MRARSTLLLALATGCPSDDSGRGELRPPVDPTFGTSSTSTGTQTTDDGAVVDTAGAECSAEMPCNDGLFCAAPPAGGAVVGPGAYTCTDVCVADDDPTRWCLDDTSCCGGRTCSNGSCRGDAVTTTDDPSSTSTTTDASTSTGDDAPGTTGDGSSSDSSGDAAPSDGSSSGSSTSGTSG